MNTEYQTFVYDLSSAGSDRVWLQTGFLSFLRATDAAGVEKPATLIEIALGEAVDDWIPFTPGSILRIQNADKDYMFKVRWEAQAGVEIKLLWGSDANNLDLEVMRSAQLVVGEKASTAAPAKVTVGNTSTAIVAANSSRQAVTIYNNGSETVFISGGTATTDDFPIAPGASYTTTTTTSAINGIVAGTSAEVRVLEEA